MYILGGKLKGRRLTNCKTKNIRPAMSLVRKSIFDTLQDFVIDANVLDLCAGTGILGIEALSRGAKKLTVIDSDKTAINLITKNLMICKLNADVIMGSLPKILNKVISKNETYELIFLDPPYGQGGFIENMLDVISQSNILDKNSLILIEHEAKCEFLIPVNFKLHKQKKYGNTIISYIKYK